MIYLYCNAKKTEYREAQRARLKAAHPGGQAILEGTGAAKWESLRDGAAAGDLIITESLRNIPAADLAADYEAIIEAGADIAFKKEPALDSILYRQAIAGRGHAAAAAIKEYLQNQIRAETAAAAAETEAHREKTRAALDAATAEGRNPGRKAGEPQTTRKAAYMKEQIRAYQAQGLKPGQILAAINADSSSEMRLSHNTLYKYMRELKAQDAQEVDLTKE